MQANYTMARSQERIIMKQRNVLSYAGGGGSSSSGKPNVTGSRPTKYGTGSAGGFTMAEILLSLTIIGVVAAITLPSLTGNINERTWNTQRKALYARFSQAIMLMPALNGYGTLSEATSSASAVDTAAETFITSGLSKVLKINNICDSEHIEDCGVASKITNLAGTTISTPRTLSELNPHNIQFNYSDTNTSISLIDTKAAAFETANGESILVFYNPVCNGSLHESSMMNPQLTMCANFVYDLNANKGPNTVGKDIGFMSAYYPSDVMVVAPYPYVRDVSGSYAQTDAGKACTNLDPEYRLPNITELSSMFANLKLLSDGNSIGDGNYYWSSDKVSSTNAWYYWSMGWANTWRSLDTEDSVRCVKR